MSTFKNLLVFLLDITDDTILNKFSFDNNLNTIIQNFQELNSLIARNVKLNFSQDYLGVTDFTLPTIPNMSEFSSILRQSLSLYWQDIQANGLGIEQIDDLLVCLVILRIIALAIRYNSTTALAITAISLISGYFWYNSFISTLFVYEQAFYRNALTYRLGVDITQLGQLNESQSFDPKYRIRITNPIGLLAYAINRATINDGHRIDPFSMVMTKIPSNFPFSDKFESYYYLLYRKIIPNVLRSVLGFLDIFATYGVYAFMTRINRRYCPYLIRWHWTLILLIKFADPFIFHLTYRMSSYAMEILTPQIVAAQEIGMTLPTQTLELRALEIFALSLISFHLSFIMFGLLHAICGQYFYVPLFTDNVELHVGPRDPYSIYSGGHTAWQEPSEKQKSRRFPKFWYGLFGRGTKTPNIFTILIKKAVYNPIRALIKKIKKLIRIKK